MLPNDLGYAGHTVHSLKYVTAPMISSPHFWIPNAKAIRLFDRLNSAF